MQAIDPTKLVIPGLNDSKTVVLTTRFLDSEQASDVVFKARICGARLVAARAREYRAVSAGGPRPSLRAVLGGRKISSALSG
jgi:hypothetical protein